MTKCLGIQGNPSPQIVQRLHPQAVVTPEAGLSTKAAMAKRRRKRTAAEKAAIRQRRKEWMWIFVRGKQKRVRRPPTIEGLDVEEYIRRNADPIWLHQEGRWDILYERSYLVTAASNGGAGDQPCLILALDVSPY